MGSVQQIEGQDNNLNLIQIDGIGHPPPEPCEDVDMVAAVAEAEVSAVVDAPAHPVADDPETAKWKRAQQEQGVSTRAGPHQAKGKGKGKDEGKRAGPRDKVDKDKLKPDKCKWCELGQCY